MRSCTRPALVEAMNVFYLAAHFARHGRSSSSGSTAARRAGFRLFRNAFLLATAVSLLVEWRFPTAPPRLAGLGLEDTLRRFSDIDIGSPGSGGLTDPVAAMPSLHAGWALGVAAGRRSSYARSRGRAAGGRSSTRLAVVLTVLVTGNHFVLDALAGMRVVMPVGFGSPRPLRPALEVVDSRCDAGWSSQVARRAHNPEVAGSNPAPAIRKGPAYAGLLFSDPTRERECHTGREPGGSAARAFDGCSR